MATEPISSTMVPIGWDLRTGERIPLKTMYERGQEIVQQTGYYQGLEALTLKEGEPIRYEKIFARLRAGMVNARETAKRIAASPIVEQEGELCSVFYSPEGDSVALSTGIIVHVHTMSEFIKFMIQQDYETDPGIHEGDLFTNNDCHVGNVHPCDIATLLPVFYQGELLGWAGTVTHVIDMGAVSPGSMPTGIVERYGDGYYVTARKTGQNFRPSKDWLIESQRAVRTPSFWTLDEKTRITADMMIRNTVLNLVQEEGLDTFKKFMRECVEDGRRGFVSAIRSMLVPGTYRGAAFVDVPYGEGRVDLPDFARKNSMMHAPSEMTITKEGHFAVSFDGANGWGWHSFNCTPAGMQGGIWVLLTQTIMANEKINDGAYYACQFDFPIGSWANTGTVRSAHAYSWHFLVSAWAPLWQALSRGYYASGYWEEVNAGNANTSNWLQGGGIDQYGKLHAVNSFESAAEGTGASAVRDGTDHGAAVWNPEADQGDMEIWEITEPLPFLGRRAKPNTSGAGRYRGGLGYESLRLVWGTKDWVMYFMGNGFMHSDSGLFGGYPGATGYSLAAHDTDLAERFAAQQPYPTGDPDPDSGEFESEVQAREIFRSPTGTTTQETYHNNDLYLNYLRGGPGVGDPLDREPERVRQDVEDESVTAEYARSLYGVAVTWRDNLPVVDEAATAALRQEMRRDRLSRGVPFAAWRQNERHRIVRGEASPQVRDMYRSSMELSEKFRDHFISFWELPADFQI